MGWGEAVMGCSVARGQAGTSVQLGWASSLLIGYIKTGVSFIACTEHLLSYRCYIITDIILLKSKFLVRYEVFPLA